MLTRVEQRSEPSRSRIDASEVRALVKIAINACQGKIRQMIGSTVFFWDYMLDVQYGQRRVLLMAKAVFAPVACPFTGGLSSRLIHSETTFSVPRFVELDGGESR